VKRDLDLKMYLEQYYHVQKCLLVNRKHFAKVHSPDGVLTNTRQIFKQWQFPNQCKPKV